VAAKKPVVQEKVVKKAKPQVKVKIPKYVSSSTDKVWRRLMITAIREAAHHSKYSQIGKEVKTGNASKDTSTETI
jgi:hypothetical protein